MTYRNRPAHFISNPLILGISILVGLTASCSTAYYSAWEMLGKKKRDLLRSNVETLKKAESSMDPVLTHLKDNALFLKHNLNAAAIGGLSSEMDRVGADIEELIADMRASIAEADRFLETLPE